MLRITPACVVMLMALTASACAAIVDGTSQLVTFDSEPNWAKIFLNGIPVG
jgi:hypothetical protein